MSSKTLSPHIHILQRSVLKVDFLKWIFFWVLLYCYWKWRAALWILPWLNGAKCTQAWQNVSQCEHTAFASTSYGKWNKKVLMEAHQCSCVPVDFRRLHQVCIMKQFAPYVVVLSVTSPKRQGRHKVKCSKLYASFSRPVVIHFLLPQGKSAEYYPSLYKCLSPFHWNDLSVPL